MLAGWDASAMPGPHPPVLMRQGNLQHALDQAVLAETLASQGFVVATVHRPPTNCRYSQTRMFPGMAAGSRGVARGGFVSQKSRHRESARLVHGIATAEVEEIQRCPYLSLGTGGDSIGDLYTSFGQS